MDNLLKLALTEVSCLGGFQTMTCTDLTKLRPPRNGDHIFLKGYQLMLIETSLIVIRTLSSRDISLKDVHSFASDMTSIDLWPPWRIYLSKKKKSFINLQTHTPTLKLKHLFLRYHVLYGFQNIKVHWYRKNCYWYTVSLLKDNVDNKRFSWNFGKIVMYAKYHNMWAT